MGFLNTVTQGSTPVGQRFVISGTEGIGKTTFACSAPKSLLIPLESGNGNIKTARIPGVLTSWGEVEALCKELVAASQAGKIARGSSLVWDSATALERFIHAETLRLDPAGAKKLGKGHSMETAHDGYGKAYAVANGLFGEWLSYLDQLALYGGINVIVTCHVFAARIIDPAHGEFDTWDLLLHSPKNQKTYGKREMLTQWADLIAFMYEPMFVAKAADGEKMNRAISQNQGRMLAVDRSPSWVAKNRYAITGSLSIPPVTGWNALAGEIFQASQIDVFNRALVPTEGA